MQRLSLRVIFCRCCCCSVFFASFSSEALFSLSLLYSDIRITTTMHLDRWKNRFLIRCVGKKTYKKEVDTARQHALLSNLRLVELLLRYSICGREKSLKEQDWKFISVIPFNLANCNNWFWKIYFKITLIGFKQLFRQFRYVSVFNRKPAIKLHLWFFFSFQPWMKSVLAEERKSKK